MSALELRRMLPLEYIVILLQSHIEKKMEVSKVTRSVHMHRFVHVYVHTFLHGNFQLIIQINEAF